MLGAKINEATASSCWSTGKELGHEYLFKDSIPPTRTCGFPLKPEMEGLHSHSILIMGQLFNKILLSYDFTFNKYVPAIYVYKLNKYRRYPEKYYEPYLHSIEWFFVWSCFEDYFGDCFFTPYWSLPWGYIWSLWMLRGRSI